MAARRKPRLAVWKFASCDGCQLSLLDCEDELLEVAEAIDIAYFMEATSAEIRGTYDISMADGSVTTPEDVERILHVRRISGFLVSIGACATAGGIQALRNFTSVETYQQQVYPHPEYIQTLATSTPFSAHVKVDYELHGCPVNKRQLLEVISAFLHGRPPIVPAHSVCVECKQRLNVCVLVTGTPCMGPVTHAGCTALCPTYARGCYGCYGPMETPNPPSLSRAFRSIDVSEQALVRAFRNYYAGAPAFREQSLASEQQAASGEPGPVEPRLLELARKERPHG